MAGGQCNRPGELSLTRQIASAIVLATAMAIGSGCALWSTKWYPVLDSVEGHQLVDLKAIGNFELSPDAAVADIPPKFRALDGRPVAFDGFIYCPDASEGRCRRFQLVYNVTERQRPTVQQRVFCTVAGGRTVRIQDAFTMVRVLGTMHVGVQRDADGRIASVYRMDVDRLEPLQ